MKEIFIIRPLSAWFLVLLALYLGQVYFFGRRLSEKTEDEKYRFLHRYYLFFVIVFIFYKLTLPLDAEYMRIYVETGWGEFSYWNELPLNPCNIILLLMPVLGRTRNKALTALCFYLSFTTPVLALLMPPAGFVGYSLMTPRVLFFYTTHFAVLISGLLLLRLGLYRPCYRDVRCAFIMLYQLAGVVFVINLLISGLGLFERVNYFYLMYPDNNPILELLYGFIPVKFVYIAPGTLFVIPYFLLITLVCRRLGKKSREE